MMIYCFTVKTGNHLWEDRFALSCDDILLFKHSTKYLVLVHVFISCDFEDAKNRFYYSDSTPTILHLSSKVQDPNIFKYNEYFFQKTINWYCGLEIR